MPWIIYWIYHNSCAHLSLSVSVSMTSTHIVTSFLLLLYTISQQHFLSEMLPSDLVLFLKPRAELLMWIFLSLATLISIHFEVWVNPQSCARKWFQSYCFLWWSRQYYLNVIVNETMKYTAFKIKARETSRCVAVRRSVNILCKSTACFASRPRSITSIAELSHLECYDYCNRTPHGGGAVLKHEPVFL